MFKLFPILKDNLSRGSSNNERPFVEEKQAIAMLKCGNLAWLEMLVNLYQLRAVRAAALITGDLTTAEDITQSAFIRAAERIAQFDDRRSFGPWFLRSVVNDAIKAASHEKQKVSLDGESQAGLDSLIDPALLPEASVESAETRQAVWSALQALPANQRAAIVLRYYLEMGEAEMASALRSPPGTVKWWLYAARKRLERLLRPYRANHNTQSEVFPEPGDKP
jgi:RNA polymerase sigma-70 factor (ECF subfamily)